MSAPRRPVGRRIPPAARAGIRATGTRTRRPIARPAPDPGPRGTWLFAIVALVVGVGSIAFVVGGWPDQPTAVAPATSPTSRPAPPTPTAEPTAALAVGDGGRDVDVGGEATQAPRRTPLPAPTTTGGTPADGAIRLDFPRGGETLVSARINAFGRGPAGGVVQHERPDGSVSETTVRDDGLWILPVDLSPGPNELRFVLAGAPDTLTIVRVDYRPR
jgi:hypothetical protein